MAENIFDKILARSGGAKHTKTPKDRMLIGSGYAYEYRGRNWKAVKDESWDTIAYTPTGQEEHVGYRAIDGMKCVVWQVPKKDPANQSRYIAQSTRQKA
jgi:hypothetical protein